MSKLKGLRFSEQFLQIDLIIVIDLQMGQRELFRIIAGIDADAKHAGIACSAQAVMGIFNRNTFLRRNAELSSSMQIKIGAWFAFWHMGCIVDMFIEQRIKREKGYDVLKDARACI